MSSYVIVGGSTGIGLSIANRLAGQGNTVSILSRTASNDWVSGIDHIPFDVLLDNVPEVPDEINGLVYCPGSINLKPFQSLSEQNFLDDFRINVTGAVRCTQAFLKSLKKTPGSSVLFFSTVAVAQGMPFHTSVSASKGAIEGLTRSLAAELAPKVRVNCIAPSITDTPLASKLLSTDEKKQKSGERHPMKRVGTAEDIAAMAVFLLSAEATWITGQIIGVDGGMSGLKPL